MFIFLEFEKYIESNVPEELSKCNENNDESEHDDNNVITETTTSKQRKRKPI